MIKPTVALVTDYANINFAYRSLLIDCQMDGVLDMSCREWLKLAENIDGCYNGTFVMNTTAM